MSSLQMRTSCSSWGQYRSQPAPSNKMDKTLLHWEETSSTDKEIWYVLLASQRKSLSFRELINFSWYLWGIYIIFLGICYADKDSSLHGDRQGLVKVIFLRSLATLKFFDWKQHSNHALLSVFCWVIPQLRPKLSVLAGLVNLFKDNSLLTVYY